MVPKGNPTYRNSDPLELARAQLDFAAMAAAAPSVREVLFKAQTMVPLSPTKPWWKAATVAGAAVLLAAALALPWIPVNATLALASLQFDRQYTRAEAQQLVDIVVRGLPQQALAGAQFGAAGDSERGPLTVTLTSLADSEAGLRQAMEALDFGAAIELAQGATLSTAAIKARRWHSPLSLAFSALRPSAYELKMAQPGREIALGVLNNQQLYAQALAAELAAVEPSASLQACEFISERGPVLERRYSFEVPAWPAPLGITLSNFAQLGAQQQAALRWQVEDFARRMNLSWGSLVLAETPQSWLPVLVDVHNQHDVSDRVLTERVQAWISQPDERELYNPEFSLNALIGNALERVLPGMDYRVDYIRDGDARPNGMRPYFYATVTVVGPRQRTLRPLDDVEAVDESTEW